MELASGYVHKTALNVNQLRKNRHRESYAYNGRKQIVNTNNSVM